MMVRLIKPEQHHSVYDHYAGSGGMLIMAREYIDEHRGDSTLHTIFRMTARMRDDVFLDRTKTQKAQVNQSLGLCIWRGG